MSAETKELIMLDITEPEIVEVEVRSDGKVIWVNVDGICRLRACRCKQVVVTDNRDYNI